jgi:hypothetical protein
VRTARLRWLAVIRQHARPGDGGRLRLGGEPTWEKAWIDVFLHAGEGPGSPLVSGEEVRIESEQHLAVYQAQAGAEESVAYIPWEAIQRISFRGKRGGE